MNCTSARFALAVMQPNSPDSLVPEFDAELAHVRECPECQAFRLTLQRSDRNIGAAMRNVPIPIGLKSRLLGQLALLSESQVGDDRMRSDDTHQVAAASEFVAEFHRESPDFHSGYAGRDQEESLAGVAERPATPASADIIPTTAVAAAVTPAAVTPTAADQTTTVLKRGMKRRSVLTLAGLAAAILISLGLWWLISRDQRHRLPIGEILAMCQNLPKPGAVPFQRGFNFELPTSTLPFTHRLQISDATSLQLGGSSEDGPEIGAVFSFSIRNTQQPMRVEACLVVVDLKQIDVPDLSPDAYSFASAHIHYPKPSEFPTRVWREGQQLYICYAKSTDNTVLESLLPQPSNS